MNHIKRARIPVSTILNVYCIMLRPIIEFCNVIYHPMLTLDQNKRIEHLQKTGLRIIYGFGYNYDELLGKAGVRSLEDRRKDAFKKYAISLTKNTRYSHWFPLNEENGRLRNTKTYREDFARTDRLYRSPIYSMRRILNDEL